MARIATRIDIRPIDTRLGPYLVDTIASTCTLDEAIGALTLAYEAVFHESGTNQTLAHAFGCIRLAIESLDTLRDTLSEAESVEVAMPKQLTDESPKERPGTRIRALLARTRPLSGNEVPDVYWQGRALVESLALSYDVESDCSWEAAQCATVLEFLGAIEPTEGNCFCNDPSDVNATCGFHVILDFMAGELRKLPGVTDGH